MLVASFSRLGVLFLSLLWCSVAHAEGRCPPGFYPTGGGDVGWLGCAPMGPIEEPASNDDGDGGYANDLPRVHYDPAQWAAWAERARKTEEALEAERMKDPKYRDLKKGVWDYAHSGASASGGVCTAVFLTLRGGVILMDWTGEAKGTYVAFFGGNIPIAKQFDKVKASLTQSGETQTVQTFHAPLPWYKGVGMIMFAVPSTDALLSSLKDKQDFDVKLGGQTVVWGEWHSGLEARDWLRSCVAKRKKS